MIPSAPEPERRLVISPIPAAHPAARVEPLLNLGHECLPSAASTTLSEVEVTGKMRRQGFPELERHWRQALKWRLPEQVSNTELEDKRQKHMEPLGRHPVLAATGTVLAGAAGAGLFVWSMSDILAPAVRPVAFALGAFNISFLLQYGMMTLRRYVIHSMDRIMAADTAFMLQQRNFRAWHEHTPAAAQVLQELAVHRVRGWDDAAYRMAYHFEGGTWKKMSVPRPHEFVQAVFREFLGYKDPEKRRFMEGRYTSHLREGKASVTAFVRSFQAELQQNARGELPIERAVQVLEILQRDFLKPESDGARQLRHYLERLQRGEFVPSQAVQAAIWDRDPWRDLTHQEEFFSSASLRGVKLMGRGPKGRLGTFGYLRNKAISALDFSLKKGRVVRARIGAVLAEDGQGQAVPGLYVDGVEGSNALKPEVARLALEDYARACNFAFIVYNCFVHNQIPRRFVRFMASQGVEARQLDIRYVASPGREYLDAFGLPLEPHEYARPQGTVIGYLQVLDPERQPHSQAPTWIQKAKNFLKRNTLWLLVSESSACAAAMVWMSDPWYLIPLAGATAAGIYAHLRYQRKSLKKADG